MEKILLVFRLMIFAIVWNFMTTHGYTGLEAFVGSMACSHIFTTIVELLYFAK